MKRTAIATLLTCYNRKSKTLESLKAVFSQTLPPDVDIHVYLVDDSSTDGTAEAVEKFYPQVTLLKGNGTLFWTGGMRKAFAEALQSDYDYYLWLNDDTTLYSGTIATLLKTSQALSEGESEVIVVGSTQDAETSELTYGGVIRTNFWHPCQFELVEPGTEPKSCATMNGNCVLIPRLVAKATGNLDSTFSHYAADYDYGLRTKRLGYSIWIAPGYMGTCSANPPEKRFQDSELGLDKKIQRLQQPKGLLAMDATILHPFQEWKIFTHRHAGLFWFIYWLLPYRRLLWAALVGSFREANV